MPTQDLGILITRNIALTLTGILAAMSGVWAMLQQANAPTTYLAEIIERTARSTERVAELAERIDARLRRQSPDIDNDLR